MKTIVAAALAAMMVTGCASMQRLGSYGDGNLSADAQVMVQGKRMNVSIHPVDSALLAQMTVGDAAAGGFVRGLTFGLAGGFKPDPRQVDAALAQLVRPTGCNVSPVREIGNDSVSFEARYTCPEGVDLRSIMRSQGPALMRGEPIRMPLG